MKKIFILLILITGTIFAAEPLVKDHAYIVSSINKSETVGAGESFSLVPQVVVATGNEKYVGSVSAFTGCYGSKRYEAGVEVGNCLISVIDSLNSDSRTDALSAYQGKVLNKRVEKIEKGLIVNLFYPGMANWDTRDLNGVIVTNNHDGTFTLNGMADDNLFWVEDSYVGLRVGKIYMEAGKEYKVLGCPDSKSVFIGGDSVGASSYDGKIVIKEHSGWYDVDIAIYKGAVLDNVVFKPMVTTSLDATYDDFVSFNDSLVTGANNGINIELLWENANAENSFDGQNVEFNAGNYDFYYIEFKRYSSDNLSTIVSELLRVGSGSHVITEYSTKIIYREIWSSNQQAISFGASGVMTQYGISAGIDNNCLIPIRIYGIR